MKRFVKLFSGTMTTSCVDQLNNYLKANPSHRVKTMTYMQQGMLYGLIVYFEVEV